MERRPAAFSLDLRRRVLADCHGGLTYAAIARKYTVSAEWVRVQAVPEDRRDRGPPPRDHAATVPRAA
ncbi:hypothetical protein [Limnoglobus roseus]|uniref:hypothetical protein n=1 Tax=Limnoglobus roseus TaxID=2598579 RepID=UPI0011EA74D9|nr:hypothetical protein [Limnoglobus roseus]